MNTTTPTATKISDARLEKMIAAAIDTDTVLALQELQHRRKMFPMKSLHTQLLIGDANVMPLPSLGAITHALSGKELEVTALVLRYWEGEEASLRLTLGFTDMGEDIAPEDRRTALLGIDGVLDLAVQVLEEQEEQEEQG